MKKLLLLFMALVISGCATTTFKEFQAEGAKGSALCITGGPGGRAGIGPGGIVTSAKVNEDFIGIVNVGDDCSINIQSFPNPNAVRSLRLN